MVLAYCHAVTHIKHMPRQQSYHRQNTPSRSNQYYSALVNTGSYTSELNTAEGHHQRYIARTEVVHNTTLPLSVGQEASRDLRNHGQSQTRRRVRPLATFQTEAQKEKTPPVIPKIIVTCPCFSQNYSICFC